MKPRVRRFFCRYLQKINEKSHAGINGYFCIKNPLLWEWQSIIFSLEQWKYHFFTQKFVEMPHLLSFSKKTDAKIYKYTKFT